MISFTQTIQWFTKCMPGIMLFVVIMGSALLSLATETNLPTKAFSISAKPNVGGSNTEEIELTVTITNLSEKSVDTLVYDEKPLFAIQIYNDRGMLMNRLMGQPTHTPRGKESRLRFAPGETKTFTKVLSTFYNHQGKEQRILPGPYSVEVLWKAWWYQENNQFTELLKSPPVKVQIKGTRSIPASAPQTYQAVTDAKDWRNPFLVVHADGIELIGVTGRISPAALPSTLERLPRSAWPYGRVVAVSEVGIRSGSDSEQIRQNLAKVLQALKHLGIEVSRWPSA